MSAGEVWEASASTFNDPDIKIYLTTGKLVPSDAIDFVRSPLAGAIIYFGGTTRNSFESKEVTQLSYEAHYQLALLTLSKIAATTKRQFADAARDKYIHKIVIVHRLGVVPVAEESIMIALSSTHRQEGWEAAMLILEQVKSRAEIWKNEVYGDGTSSWKENETSQVI